MYHKHKVRLRGILAWILSAVMIFTTDSQVLTAAVPSAMSSTEVTDSAEESMTALAEDTTVSDDAATADGADISADDAADPAVSAGDAMTLSGIFAKPFTLTPADIQYGEDGSNRTGNLDALFAPRFVANDSVLTLKEDYTVTYKFFTGDAPASPEAFAKAEGVPLETIPAGTKVTVCALADTLSDAAPSTTAVFASATFTVQKRKVVIRYTVPKEDVLDGREIPEDGQLVIPRADILPENLTVSVSEDASADSSFAAKEELNAALAEVIEGDLTLDVSAVDVTTDGYQVVPADFTLAPSFDDNYEIVGNIFGDVYVKKAQYYVTLTVNNNGEQWAKTYPLDSGSEKALNEYSFYNDLKKDCQSFINKQKENLAIVGWLVYTDGFNDTPIDSSYTTAAPYNTTNLNADAYTYELRGTKKTFTLSGKTDYHFVAQVTKAAAENLYVTTIPSVFYDGRAHMVVGSKTSAKKQAADLRVKVYSGLNMNSYNQVLELGKDYIISNYKNNVNSSMKLVGMNEAGSGSYVKTWTKNEERPCLTITGIGAYKGFSADVYFDILPQNLGATDRYYDSISEVNDTYNESQLSKPYTYVNSLAATITPFADGYVLKNGKLTTRIKPVKVTKSYYSYNYDLNSNLSNRTEFSRTLKEGIDYTGELYLWNATDYCWEKQTFSDPNLITRTGDYLYVIRGIGNYCGSLYKDHSSGSSAGSGNFNYFSDGKKASANPSRNLASAYQFAVRASAEYDFSKTKISVSKKSLPFKEEAGKVVTYDPADFGITVKNGEGRELELGRDYIVSFTERYGHRGQKDGITYGATVGAANEYTIKITPMGSYYGAPRSAGTVKIKGLKLKTNYFRLSAKKVPLGEQATWSVSPAGEKLGITTKDETSSYYVYDGPAYSYNGRLESASKVTVYVGGSSSPSNARYGYGIDPTSTVKLTYSRTPVSLQQAYQSGLIRFKFADGAYNVKGAMPSDILVSSGQNGSQTSSGWDVYAGCTWHVSVYDAQDKPLGVETLTFTAKNNTKVGGKATITVKGTGVYKGSLTIKEAFTVQPRKVSEILSKASDEQLYIVFTDGQMGKASLDKPKFKLYQTYRTTKGLKSAVIKTSQYKWEVVRASGNTRACGIKITNIDSPNRAFDFGKNGITCSCYALYDKAKLPAVTSVKFYDDATVYKVTKNHIDGYAPAFTGHDIFVVPEYVTLADGTVLYFGSDFTATQSRGSAAGSNAGSISFTTHYNAETRSYPYKGSATLKFDITANPKITL